MISHKTKKEYIKASGSFCINCGSGNISAGKVESEGREAWQPVQCYACGCEWNDIFRLEAVAKLFTTVRPWKANWPISGKFLTEDRFPP